MKHTQAYCEDGVRRAPDQPVDPQAAVAAGLRTMPYLLGSATATVATLGRSDAILRVYNIGDSGLQVWRWDPKGTLDPPVQRSRGSPASSAELRAGAWRLLFHTTSQQTSFNAPLQLAKDKENSNEVGQGEVSVFAVQPGDLVLATVSGMGVGVCSASVEWLTSVDAKFCALMYSHASFMLCSADRRASRQLVAARRAACSRSAFV